MYGEVWFLADAIEDIINNSHKIALGEYHHKVGEIFHNIDHNLYLGMECIHKVTYKIEENLLNHQIRKETKNSRKNH